MNNDGLGNQVNLKIVGHDNRAEVELRDGVVYRSVFADHVAETEEVLSKCASNSDTTKLLVSTEMYSKSQ